MSHYRCSQVVSCGWQGADAKLSWSGPHVKVECPKCGKFIKFAKQDRLDHGDFRLLDKWQQRECDKLEKKDFELLNDFYKDIDSHFKA